MAASLKFYIPTLAYRLGTTAAALYERQRALMRAGILLCSPGRGPGSGVQVSPQSVALLLIGISTTDSLSDTPEKVRIFAGARSAPDGKCPLTGTSYFADAVARVLDPHQELDHSFVKSITVGRTSGLCCIHYNSKRRSNVSQFVANVPVSADLQVTTRLQIEATIQRDLIVTISRDLKQSGQARPT